MSKREELSKTAESLLEPGESLLEFTIGSIGESGFETLVILTSKRLRLGSATGGESLEFSNIKRLEWSGLWARLNVQVRSPKRKLVLSVYGGEWKEAAKRLAELATPMLSGS
jgi:hypothetical protein